MVRGRTSYCRSSLLSTSLALGVAGLVPAAISVDDVMVTGDARLLQTLLDAQQTNQSRFRFGRLHATLQDLERGRECDLKLIWDGPLTYRDYAETLIQGNSFRNVTRRIESPEEYWALNNGEHATHYIGKYHNGTEFCDQRPDESWFCVRRNQGLSFTRFFDPSHRNFHSAKPEDTALHQWNVSEEASGLVRVRMTGDGRFPWSGDIVVSLLQGANVIKYQLRTSSVNNQIFWFGSFDWAQDREQRWYLSKASHGQRILQLDEQAPEDPEPSFHVTVHEFDGSNRPPRSQFQKEVLQIPDGIPLEVVHADGRRERGIVGGPAAIVSNPHLKDLLEQQFRQLQTSGFIGRPRQ